MTILGILEIIAMISTVYNLCTIPLLSNTYHLLYDDYFDSDTINLLLIMQIVTIVLSIPEFYTAIVFIKWLRKDCN